MPVRWSSKRPLKVGGLRSLLLSTMSAGSRDLAKISRTCASEVGTYLLTPELTP